MAETCQVVFYSFPFQVKEEHQKILMQFLHNKKATNFIILFYFVSYNRVSVLN